MSNKEAWKMENQNIIDNQALAEMLSKKGLGLKKFVETAQIVENIKLLRPIGCGIDLIRIGGEGDGGYIIPDDLDGVSYCFSPGVSDIAEFEKGLFDLYGIKSFLADYSVEAPPKNLEGGDFERKFISTKIGEPFITLEDWVDRKSKALELGDLILQMDIEGGEYDAIISASPKLLKMFRIIVIEFHMLDEMIFDRFDFFGSVFRKITEDHRVVHLHPNNCCASLTFNGVEIPRVLEVTLIRNDRIKDVIERTDFPHHLDRKNVNNIPELRLPDIWYKVS